MTEQEKLQCIKDMGIITNEDCPDLSFGIKIYECLREDGWKKSDSDGDRLCDKCWIKTLEE
jgi:hypothetical protein